MNVTTRPVILALTGRSPGGWEEVLGHGCDTQAEMEAYAKKFGDGGLTMQFVPDFPVPTPLTCIPTKDKP